MLIEGQYHAAVEICNRLAGCEKQYGIFHSQFGDLGQKGLTTIRATDAIAAADAYIKQEYDHWCNMDEERVAAVEAARGGHTAALEEFARNLANIGMCRVLWESIFDADATLCFQARILKTKRGLVLTT